MQCCGLNRGAYRRKYPLGLHPEGRAIAVFFPLTLMEVKEAEPHAVPCKCVPSCFCPTKPSRTFSPGSASVAGGVQRC